MSADGQKVLKTETFNGISSGLDVLTGTGGAIVGIDFSGNSISVATPNHVVTTTTAYDIFPGEYSAGQLFEIGGVNFGQLGNTTVTIGNQQATVTAVTPNRIKGILPSLASTGGDLLDVIVQSGGQTSMISDAFLPLA
uniref:IPT/TIG domain-containing protein n=1 Tax=Desertifilum tharense IPPAS B-1220 TaxID=1781255 RepID=A0ACD5GQV7_9CYAN